MGIKRSRRAITAGRILLVASVAVVLLGIGCFCAARRFVSKPVLDLGSKEREFLFIPTGANFDDVMLLLESKSLLADAEAFRVMASLTDYDANVRPGRYELKPSMSAKGLVDVLRRGLQSPVNVTFNNIRKLDALAGALARNIEADSAAIYAAMLDTAFLAQCGMDVSTLPALFLPDTYQVWWSITPSELMQRLKKEYDRFWTQERKAKADSVGLTVMGVSTLASIIDEESNVESDMRIIAGLYLNRLSIGMPLQACPTLKFAMGDFTVKRILNADMQIESPYNTYKYPGLPPGPIRIPSKRALEAVLNPTPSDYLFMCARPDGSGLHDFARTLKQHQQNANNYHKALNRQKIYR